MRSREATKSRPATVPAASRDETSGASRKAPGASAAPPAVTISTTHTHGSSSRRPQRPRRLARRSLPPARKEGSRWIRAPGGLAAADMGSAAIGAAISERRCRGGEVRWGLALEPGRSARRPGNRDDRGDRGDLRWRRLQLIELVIGGDDLLHQLVADHVALVEGEELDPGDVRQHLLRLAQARLPP